MTWHKINALMFLLVLQGSGIAFSQIVAVLPEQNKSVSEDGVWERFEPAAMAARANEEKSGERFRPRVYQLFKMNAAALQTITDRTPRERSAVMALDGQVGPELTLPSVDGTYLRYRIEQTDVLAPELAAKFPEIKTFRGVSEDGKSQVHADLGPEGLHAQIMSTEGITLVDPWDADGTYAVYWKREASFDRSTFRCGVTTPERPAAARVQVRPAATSGTVFRTYRLALACTGEYAAKRGGTVTSVLSAMATTINRVNQIYQRDLCIRLQLVPNNDKLVFLNAATDPFNGNGDAGTLIDESQTVIDEKVGNANYDIGHTLSTGAGGLAGLGVVCIEGRKANGVTGRDNPVGDPFDIDYVAHEIGHQFAGNHTFNGKIGSCSGGNRNATTAVEPGSGSTIQAYAGICGADDLQPNSDPYFHAVSLDEMLTFINTGPGSTVSGTPTTNSPPIVSAGNDFRIPKGTPFQLTATGSDPDGDALTYCWEQMDAGLAANLGTPDNGAIPLFRSFAPSVKPIRTFPQLSTLLSGANDPSEILPTQNRIMAFRVTARDNRAVSGGVRGDDVQLTVVQAAGPFRLTSPTGGTHAGVVDVRWDVANTNAAPIEAQFVNILLSTDGGQSFSTTLAANSPNDGNQLVSLPSASSGAARIKVEAVGNIFFNISPTFQISQARSVTVLVRHAEKDTSGGDPALTAVGQKRAIALSQEVANCRLRDIWVTSLQRSSQTALPTAQQSGLTLHQYDDHSVLIESLSNVADGSTTLVVGHTDTLSEMLTKLTGTPGITVSEDQFDQMFVVVRASDDQIQMIQRTYSGQPVNVSGIVSPELVARPAKPSRSLDPIRERLQRLKKDLEEIEKQIDEIE